MAVIQLTSDTLSIEYQRVSRASSGGLLGDISGSAAADGVDANGNDSSVEGEQVVRCDISVKGFHLQVYCES